MRRLDSTVGLFLVSFTLSGAAGAPGEIALFDGASLAGWHISTASGHSTPSGHRAGCQFERMAAQYTWLATQTQRGVMRPPKIPAPERQGKPRRSFLK